MCEKVCQFTCGLSPNTLYIKISGFSLPPIKTDHHRKTEKLLSMAKKSKQTNKQTNQKKTHIGNLN
jgi:hypothetical protein